MFFILSTKEKRAECAKYIAHLRGNPVQCVDIKNYKRIRSTAQNRTMWMWYNIISEETGQDPDDIHEEMKVRVLGVEKRIVHGQALIMPKSSAKLSTKEMAEFLRAIEELATELSIVLPKPDDYQFALCTRRNDV